MGLVETADGFMLPHPTGPIQARFDGTRHPLLAALNTELNEVGKYHKGALRDFGPVNYDEHYGGDPFFLSALLAPCANGLLGKGKVELALEVLDEGLRWPDNCIKGGSYITLARSAAEKNYTDIALGIALDPRRILAGRRPQTLDNLPSEYGDEHRVALAAEWLGEACPIYQCTTSTFRKRAPERLVNYFLSVVDTHSDVLASGLPAVDLAEVAEIVPRDKSVVQQLGLACEALHMARQVERAERLAGLHSAIPYRPSQEVGAA